MTPQIVLLGVDHRRAPVEVREELSFTQDQVLALLPELVERSGAQEAFLLATCNRTEFYLAYDGESPVAAVLQILKRLRSQARCLHEDCLRFIETDDRAAGHLFRVTAGIESQLLGDTQIVTQVKQAHRLAVEAGTLGPWLDRTVTESLRAAKRARRETEIGKGAASVGAAVLRSVRHAFADLSQVGVMVLGGGEAGRDIAHHLSKVPLASLTFAARNQEQAASMAREFHGVAANWGEVHNRLPAVDVLIAATSARLAILDEAPLRCVTQNRSRSLLIVDAGIPRNVDPGVAELSHVRLLNLDSLEREQAQALEARRQEIPRVESILAQELERWRRWWLQRSQRRGTIGQLRE
ncbi:MAG TPA: glutamyl-tRNA reductase, partial [Bryobacteraceae bacterium]|nr:glutamyl-tRNA reductase [Bryobacteraceae bacterium]